LSLIQNIRGSTTSKCDWEYKFSTNDDPHGPSYDFEDLTTHSDTKVGYCNDCNIQVELGGLGFPFYCQNQTHFSFGSNGGLRTPSDTYLTMQNSELITNDIGSDGGIFILWQDNRATMYYKHFDSCPHILYKYDNIGCDIFQWTLHISYKSDSKIQAILFENGSILFQYGRGVHYGGRSATIGIQEYDQLSSVQYSFKRYSVTDELAILFEIDHGTSPCDSDNEAPVARCQNKAYTINPTGTLSIAASDIDHGSTDNCDIASFGIVPNTFTRDDIGDNEITLTVTDDSGNSDTCTSIITISDHSDDVMCGFNHHKHLLGLGTFYVQDDNSHCYKVVFGKYIFQGHFPPNSSGQCDETVNYNYFVGALDRSESESTDKFEYRHGDDTHCENDLVRTATITIRKDENVSQPTFDVVETDLCTYTFELKLHDCDRPSISMVDAVSVGEDEAIVIPILTNDEDSADNVTISITKGPSNGGALSGRRSLTYTPSPNFYGSDSFVYRVCDANKICDSANMTITVYARNDAPVAVDDTAIVGNDATVYIPILGNDYDIEGNELSVSIYQKPSHGNSSIVISYTPDVNYNGIDSFEYKICDAYDACDTATVNITVN